MATQEKKRPRRKVLTNTLFISSSIVFILAIISAAIDAFNLIDNAKIYVSVQAIIRSTTLFFLLVFFSAFQQLRRKVAGIREFFFSRLVSISGFGLTVGSSERLLGRSLYLTLSLILTAYVLAQGFEVK